MRVVKDCLQLEYIEIEQEVRSSGIIVSGTPDQRKVLKSKVLAVGGEVKEVQAGDTVYFTRQYSETKEIEGIKYFFLREGDIIGIE